MIKKIKQISIITLIFFTAVYAGVVAAHGKVALEDDECVRNMAGSMVHLSTYQPQFDPEAEYCAEIPQEGETLWVLDLIDQALRDMPIGIQIVRGSGKALGETVASLYSTDHPDGVIKGEFSLDRGQYTVFITGEGIPTLHYEYPLRVQMMNYTDAFRAAVGPLIALLLLALFTKQYLKWRRLKH